MKSQLNWISIYSKIKPNVGDKCLISDDDGNCRLATYSYLNGNYCFFDIISGHANPYVYCWAKLPSTISDKQLNKIDREEDEEIMSHRNGTTLMEFDEL